MTEMINTLQRARQLANRLPPAVQRTAHQHRQRADRAAQQPGLAGQHARQRGNALFGGDAADAAYTVDATTGLVSYVGSGSAGSLELGDGQSVKRSLTGPEFLTFSSGGTSTDVFAALKSITDAITAGGSAAQTAASAALTTLDDAMTAVSTGQTVVGARLSWIDLNTERQTTMSEARAQDQSTIGATDIPTAYSRLTELATVLAASQASFTKMSGLSLFNMMS
jgi:flagellar hook-associated protein 3 FlgL